jgi:hypothetical protein
MIVFAGTKAILRPSAGMGRRSVRNDPLLADGTTVYGDGPVHLNWRPDMGEDIRAMIHYGAINFIDHAEADVEICCRSG